MNRPVDIEIEVERYELSKPRRYPFELERREFMRDLRRDRRRAAGVCRRCRRCRAGVGPRRAAGVARQTCPPGCTSTSRPRHRLHGEDGDRPEHPDIAGAGHRRRIARAARTRVAGDGRYRPGAVRPGDVRIAIHAADGAAARARRRGGPRDADRSRRGAAGRWTAPR